ncbi:phosphate signaling complex protein PhoU [Fulvivirgaceae bacterium PWU4]|uniref:Phosphate-specific transport system accessory protein PhoU n=1 Tax=Chryseosolibacter histidini TaxID=2782349 RepID=A0AAP2DG58_9BACT|nr:phosphate signaling complex protein PhoU [Chryseosolibacter histidini]MBT1695610.1 phosphate signaling complex protein PhoU [Chryseosolibacter histidini]
MPAIEPELQALKENLLDMLSLVRNQLTKCKKAIQKKDLSIAEEVIADERKVNVQELAIDRDCESILALYTPVATDLRLVLATLKITNDLERIGDNAKSLARFLKDNLRDIPGTWIEKYNIEAMLDVLTSMLKDMGEALHTADTKLARHTTKHDEQLNKYNREAYKTAAELIKEHPESGKILLTLFSLTRDLERAGDLTKNIAEEIVFHIEAKVMKHKKDQK